jgi:hypothetical protein
MEQPIKPKKVMTPEQLEILKARLMKARDAKIARTKGPVKEEPKQIPITKVVNEIVKETPFEKPLPKKRIPKPKPVKQPNIIPFEEELPKPKPQKLGWKMPPPSDPINIPKKDKHRFCKIVYYSEPSKKTLKKLNKIQDSSSSESESESDDELVRQPVVTAKPKQISDEDAYYRELAKRLYS